MRAQQRLILSAACALLATALLGVAHAEGGLPGSPAPVPEGAQRAAQPAPDAGVAEPGGAAFSPFVQRSATSGPGSSVQRDPETPDVPGLALTAAVTLAGVAALGWLARLAWH